MAGGQEQARTLRLMRELGKLLDIFKGVHANKLAFFSCA